MLIFHLQQNSNSSFIPLLLLLRDTSREDGELCSDSKNNTEISILKQQLDDSVNSSHVRELIQGKELMNQLKLQNDVAPTITAANDPNQSPVYMEGDPGIVNFNAVQSHAARKRKAVLTWTKRVRVSSESKLEEYDDGHSWIKYRQENALGAKYPRSSSCIYWNCMAWKRLQRSNENPTIFEVVYEGFHSCSRSQQPRAWLEEQEHGENSYFQQQEYPRNSVILQHSANSPFSLQRLGSDPNLNIHKYYAIIGQC
ncbi:WRKY family transcription factor [Euphorbia peplus]|nr:WRKY family transcription factor [Euphorbia peplus]